MPSVTTFLSGSQTFTHLRGLAWTTAMLGSLFGIAYPRDLYASFMCMHGFIRAALWIPHRFFPRTGAQNSLLKTAWTRVLFDTEMVNQLSDKPANAGRHQRKCTVCAHPERQTIEADFIAGRSPAAIAAEYRLADSNSVYRHAHATGLFAKRLRNIRAALERIIEKAGEVEVTAGAVVAAIQAYSKINAVGQWIDRTETVSLNALFDSMSTQELEEYAKAGTVPKWFETATLTAVAGNSQES
jgi:hypothetical protein